GVPLAVHGKAEPEPFHVQVGSDVSDLPASRKTSGLLACTSKYFMCDHCDTPFYALVDPDSFDPITKHNLELNARDPWRYLKYAFRARDASEEVAEEISQRRGVRYSVVDRLVNWLLGETGLFDPMHAIFGTVIRHLCKNILFKNGMVNTKQMEKLERFFKDLIWPPSISRLPPSVARGAGSIKADQWRSQITVFFVGLFHAWEVDGEIPDVDAEPSAPPKRSLYRLVSVRMDRSLRRHYDAVVQFTAGVRILTSNTISPNEVGRGCKTVQCAVQSWAAMNCHLVPYFHYMAAHLEPQFLKHGPIPGWWTFPYERNNGFLGRFNHNGHSGGEIEGTMMRGWWKTTMIQDLVRSCTLLRV
ncbi:hypothetical protein B0H16DRAFT_1313721, partial [Mycena metata]